MVASVASPLPRRRERARPKASRRAGAKGTPGEHNAALSDHLPSFACGKGEGRKARGLEAGQACCVTPIM